MKVNWFHLMPYRWLPEDFCQRYRSVWVDIPSKLWDATKGHFLYNEYLDELEFAEKMGMDGVCVNEHHANAYGLMPSPNLMAAALARRTSGANLIVLGDSLALYNPALRVAEEFAMLDCISGGRLVAGFPVGSSMDTNFAYGTVPATVRDRLTEAIKGLRIGQLMTLQMIGSMPKELVLKNTELFATEVMPSIKKIWTDKWQDRWSPQPLAERAIPGEAVAN